MVKRRVITEFDETEIDRMVAGGYVGRRKDGQLIGVSPFFSHLFRDYDNKHRRRF